MGLVDQSLGCLEWADLGLVCRNWGGRSQGNIALGYRREWISRRFSNPFIGNLNPL